MPFDDIAVFVKVVQTGSFGKAAVHLQLSKSTVSTKVAQLERRLGATLLQRTTRRLHTTSAGQAFYEDCTKALEIVAAAEAKVNQEQNFPQGQLRVSVPVGLADSILPGILQTFAAKHPEVEVDVHVSDQFVDLVGEGFDLAIRGGELKDSSLIGKKIGKVEFGLYASPAYLKRNGTPRRPKDLFEHASLGMTFKSTTQIARGKELFQLPEGGRIRANNLALAKRLALMGLGIALLDSLNTAEDIKADRLIRVLPEWKAESYPLYLLYPAHKFVSPKLRVFMEMAAAALARHFES